MAPSKFYVFNQGVRKGISSGKIPASVWVANPELPGSYLATSEKHDEAFHEAKHGSDLAMMQRDLLQQQLVEYLDEMASILEAAAIRSPDLLLYSGYDLGKERRITSRAKPAPAPGEGANAESQANHE